MITSFEVQTRQQGYWQINAVFDDEELATQEAFRILEEGGQFTAVRVIEEAFSEETGVARERLVLRLAVPEKYVRKSVKRTSMKREPEPAGGVVSEKQLQREQRRIRKDRGRKWRRKWFVRMSWFSLAVIIIGLPIAFMFDFL